MSILLDALKKSEHQRRVGEVPDIHSAGPEASAPEEGGFDRLTWVLLAAAFVTLLWLAWRQYAPVDAQSAEPVADETTQAGADPAPATEMPAGARTPVESLAQGEPQSALEKPATAAGAGAAPETTAASVAEEQQSDAAEPAAGQAKKPAAKLNTAGKQAQQNAAPEQQPANRPKPPTPISYWEVPQGVREEMPEFRINVLVYADDPADRFILLNGKRQVQLDFVVPGLRVVQIQRDRVIFNYRKYRFYVKQ